MGKRLDALLGRSFKTSRFKALVNLAISRLVILKNQRQSRCSLARSDVIKLLQTGEHEKALMRVGQVIVEKNMWDALVMIETYCNLLIERICLIEQEKVCPEEIKEAIASLIYAASRCGDFPELQKIRGIFSSRYGKEFEHRAIELRNHCGVSPKIVQRLSTRFPGLENRMKLLEEIASENNICLQLEGVSTTMSEQEKNEQMQSQSHHKPALSATTVGGSEIAEILEMPDEMEKDGSFSGCLRGRKYRDAADAAQEAFESASYAAIAAKAAMELAGAGSCAPSHQSSLGSPREQGTARDDTLEFDTEIRSNPKCSESRRSVSAKDDDPEFESERGNNQTHSESKRLRSGSSAALVDVYLNGVKQEKLLHMEIFVGAGNTETKINQSRITGPDNCESGSDMKPMTCSKSCVW